MKQPWQRSHARARVRAWLVPSDGIHVARLAGSARSAETSALASIFVSYRRTDAPGHAGRLYDRLVDSFGEANVFKDVDSMEPGADYVEIIEETIAKCDALIAVIGPQWLGAELSGRRCLDDPEDWVRLEIVNALDRRARVIPVLVHGASMPSAADLPPELKAFARRHAVQLDDMAWIGQVRQLIDSLKRALQRDRLPAQPTRPTRGLE